MHNLILFFDTETTGIPKWKTPSTDKSQPHIVQLAAVLVDEETKDIRQSMNVIVRPEGWEIPQETVEIHSVTTDFAMHVGVSENLALLMLFALASSSYKRVAYNAMFDNRIIKIGTKRHGTKEMQNNWRKGKYECAMQTSRKVIGGKNPKLIDAYKHFTGKDLEGAHGAMPDTLACMKVYFAIKDQEVYKTS